MDLLYRVLGIGAGVNDGTSRFSINGVPFNLLMILGMGLGAFVCLIFSLIAAEEAGPPHPVRIAEVLAHPDTTPSWIKTTGNLVPAVSLAETNSAYDPAFAPRWVPLVDATGKKGVLVRVADPAAAEGETRTVEITGRLTTLDSDLQQELRTRNAKLGGIQLNTEWAILEGRTMPDPVTFFCIAVVLGLCCLPLFSAFILRNVIFRKVPPAVGADDLSEGGPLDLRATGHFVLEARVGQRFLNMPCGFELTETRELILFANIDASSKLYGFTTHRRQGIWAIVIPLGTLRVPETGLMYLGTDTRPALRLRYIGYPGGSQETILSFADERQRVNFLRALEP